MSYGRGPDPVELALAGYMQAVLNLLAFEPLLLRRVDDLIAGEKALRQVGIGAPPLHVLSRELRNVKRMRDGDPFWDRDPAEPVGDGLPMLEP
jgi:hypothetical protein